MPRKFDVININGKYGSVFGSGGGIQGERDVRQRPLSASVVEATQDFTAVVRIERRRDVRNDAQKMNLRNIVGDMVTKLNPSPPYVRLGWAS